MTLRQILSLLLCAVLLLVPMAAWAAPGDATVFSRERVPGQENEPNLRAEQMVLLDDTFYGLGEKAILRWKLGMEKPEVFCTFDVEVGPYYGEYAKASGDLQAELGQRVTHIAAGDGKLWAFNNLVGKVGEITQQGLSWLDIQLDMTDMTFEEQYDEVYVRNREIAFPMVADSFLYCLRDNYTMDNWAENRVLVKWDLKTGAQTAYVTDHAQMIAAYKPGQLLTFGAIYDSKKDKQVSGFTLLDMATGNEEILSLALPQAEMYGVCGLVYDGQNDNIYFTWDRQIWCSEKSGPFKLVAYLTQGYANYNSPAWLLPGGLYGIFNWELYIRNIDPQYLPTRTLRLQGGWEDQTYMAFAKARPDVPVLMVNEYLYTGEEVAKAIAGGDNQTDIFALSMGQGVRDLIDKGYAADLSASEVLSADLAAMYPQVQKALSSADGRPMAYPISIGYNPWTVDMELWEHFDMGPLPTTFSEFFAYKTRWEAEFAEDNPEFTFMDSSYVGGDLVQSVINHYIRQYEQPDKPIDFKAPALREVLENIAALDYEAPDFDNMSEADWEAYSEMMNRPAIFYLYGRMGMFYDTNRTQFVSSSRPQVSGGSLYVSIPPMVFEAGHEGLIPASMQALIINPASPNIDLALAYLEMAAQEGLDNYARYALRPDLNEPMEYENFQEQIKGMMDWRKEIASRLEGASGEEKLNIQDDLDFLDRWLAEEDKNRWEISAGAIAEYRKLAPLMNFSEDSTFFKRETGGAMETLNGLAQRYIEENLSLDTFLNELDSKMRMIYLEGK